MINLREVEEAIRELQAGAATYNNCMKLASLYIIRDEFMKDPSRGMHTYSRYPMTYERGRSGGQSGNSSSSNYGYREPYDRPMMYHEQDDMMIGRDTYSRRGM